MITPTWVETFQELHSATTAPALWGVLVSWHGIRSSSAWEEPFVLFTRLHRDDAADAVVTAALLCTDHRWGKASYHVIQHICTSGVLAAPQIDELAEWFLVETFEIEIMSARRHRSRGRSAADVGTPGAGMTSVVCRPVCGRRCGAGPPDTSCNDLVCSGGSCLNSPRRCRLAMAPQLRPGSWIQRTTFQPSTSRPPSHSAWHPAPASCDSPGCTPLRCSRVSTPHWPMPAPTHRRRSGLGHLESRATRHRRPTRAHQRQHRQRKTETKSASSERSLIAGPCGLAQSIQRVKAWL